jgi:hypothetical protein
MYHDLRTYSVRLKLAEPTVVTAGHSSALGAMSGHGAHANERESVASIFAVALCGGVGEA